MKKVEYHTRRPPVDLWDTFPDFQSLRTSTIRLHPRRGDDLPDDVSKIGGSFLNVIGQPWPKDPETNDDYIPVLQILKSDLVGQIPGAPRMIQERGKDPKPFDPALDVFSFKPGSDCFQLLWSPRADQALPQIETRWLSTSTKDYKLEGQQIEYRELKGERIFPRECRLHPEFFMEEYPDVSSLSSYHKDLLSSNPNFLKSAKDHWDPEHGEIDETDWNWKEDVAMSFYAFQLGAAPGTKLGGHPEWVQDSEWPLSDRGLVMEHLLTIASWEWDGGSFRRWKPVEEDNSTSSGGDGTELMLGDAGSVYLFVSREEDDWPVKGVFQCS